MTNVLIEILKFYHESGVDCCLNEEKENLHSSLETSYVSTQEKTEQLLCPEEEAQKLAENCTNITELENAIKLFDRCELKKTSKNTVFSDGNPKAKIMLIGEAPGANEDLAGKPFCGTSGKLLDKMLESINLDRNLVYITNTVFWRPPGNRRPTEDEISICRPFLEKHISLLSPKILVLVGGTACYSLLKSNESISKMRGKFHSYTNHFLEHSITTTVLFHPAYLLRQPMQKRIAWEDLKMISKFINDNEIIP